jgi:hypothetical protein
VTLEIIPKVELWPISRMSNANGLVTSLIYVFDGKYCGNISKPGSLSSLVLY